ncbi:glycosyltransferase family 2 protein [Candidatus Woesebacteria bacterium]|nr:glycosyltransferase family 2 protein [Candidatus Woesebacteria bacterium]
MESLSVIIHTRNEERNVKACIESARLLSDDVMLIDMQSIDKTVAIAKRFGVQVKNFPFTHYVEPARAFGITHARGSWVFILDADERITPALAKEIKNVVRRNDSKMGCFKVPRKNIFGKKKWLEHGGWWPDYQIRLIHKPHFKNWPTAIHSTPQIIGEMGFLKEPLLHYFHGDLAAMVTKTTVFEEIEADLLYKAGRRVTTLTFFRKFLAELYRRLIRDKGFLDGAIGFIESIYQAYSKTITYFFLYEKRMVHHGKKQHS